MALDVVAAAALLTDAGLDSANVVRTLLVSGASSGLAIETLVRSVLESAAQVWWLLEPGIGGRARMARLYVLRRQSACALQGTAAKLQVQLGSGYGQTVDDMVALYERELGLRPDHSHKGVWVGCEGQRKTGYTDRVARFMGDIGHAEDKGPYAFICGASHMEFWRLSYGYEEIENPDGSREWMPRTPRDFLRLALSVTTDALVYPAARAFDLLGRQAALRELVGLLPGARRALTD
ncbi:hypothetical protein [Actinoplanes sp. TFC3]|uniref:hypothetical protein n=1 Tax=Actinoplanes sp. TFC3 TaxID=1710355 RepID=UPI00082F2CE7|nr:hypothetical protein [Actinoplanes sp. TFC3]